MYIYHSKDSDILITDTVTGLNEIAEKLQNFLYSDKKYIEIPAIIGESPIPYEAFLSCLHLTKTHEPIHVSVENDGLYVRGSIRNLDKWSNFFRFPDSAQDGDHHHPEYIAERNYLSPNSLSVIIEVEEDI